MTSQIVVKQVPGSYKFEINYSLEYLNKNNRSTLIELAQRDCEVLRNDIEQNFNISRISIEKTIPAVYVTCYRTELRKIESWFLLQGRDLVPLKRWKNEKSFTQ